MISFIVLLAAIKFKFARNENIIDYLRRKHDAATVTTFRHLETTSRKLRKAELELKFLYTCRLNCLVPNFVKFKLYKKSLYNSDFYHEATNSLLNLEINYKEKITIRLENKLQQLQHSLKCNLSFLEILYIHSHLTRYAKSFTDRIKEIHNNKLLKLGISQPDFKFVDRVVFNHSSYTLSKKEKFLLSLGMDFCLPFVKPKFINYFAAFEKLANVLSSFSNNENFSAFRRDCSHLAYKTFTGHWSKNWLPFINKGDIESLRKLGNNRDLIVTKPDKGNGVVIMNRSDYDQKMLHILNDTTKFQPVDDTNQYKIIYRIEDKINRFLSKLKSNKVLSNDMYSDLHVSGSSFGILYGSPKVHKEPAFFTP